MGAEQIRAYQDVICQTTTTKSTTGKGPGETFTQHSTTRKTLEAIDVDADKAKKELAGVIAGYRDQRQSDAGTRCVVIGEPQTEPYTPWWKKAITTIKNNAALLGSTIGRSRF